MSWSLKNWYLAPVGGLSSLNRWLWALMSSLNRWFSAKNWGILQTRMDQRWDHMKMNFEYFQIQKWVLQRVRSEKVDEKMGPFLSFPCTLPELRSLNCLNKYIFCKFMLTSAKNLGLLKHFTYMHLEGLVTHFQKMILFIMLWLTVLGILVFENEEFC